MQVPVIGQRQGIHSVIDAAIDQLSDVPGTVQQAVVAVAMQVGEGTLVCARIGSASVATDSFRT